MNLLKEYLAFLTEEKKYWLIPLIILLLIAGSIIIFAETSALAPMIYVLF